MPICHDLYFLHDVIVLMVLVTCETLIFSVDGSDALFTVNAASGEVSLQGVLDREMARTHIITIQVSFFFFFYKYRDHCQ